MQINSRKNIDDIINGFNNPKKINILNRISKNILPYNAKFIADPFLRYINQEYHIFCEVFINRDDKRIVHFKKNRINQKWIWVSDILKGDNYSYPAIYEYDDEILIAPLIGNKKKFSVFKYPLYDTNIKMEIKFSISLDFQPKDINWIKNPYTKENYLIYGSKTKNVSGLFISKFRKSNNKILLEEPIKIKINKFKYIMQNIFKQNRLSFRPAGDILYNDYYRFILPIQATIGGIYGELFCLCEITWKDFILKEITYVYPKYFGNYTRTHHLSVTKDNNNDVLLCSDVIKNKNNWEIIIYKLS